MIAAYPCPLPGGGSADEYAFTFDRGRDLRLLVVPALFDEGNRLRRHTLEVMRRLDGAGIDCFLPDLPGLGESLLPLADQTPDDWLSATAAAARHFGATHVLTVRGGALAAPPGLAGWAYAPVTGAAILRQLMRARIVAAREAGREETQEALMAAASAEGIELAGYRLGPEFVEHFRTMEPSGGLSAIPQDMVGGAGLWLRAEAGEDRAQADALAAVVAVGMRA